MSHYIRKQLILARWFLMLAMATGTSVIAIKVSWSSSGGWSHSRMSCALYMGSTWKVWGSSERRRSQPLERKEKITAPRRRWRWWQWRGRRRAWRYPWVSERPPERGCKQGRADVQKFPVKNKIRHSCVYIKKKKVEELNLLLDWKTRWNSLETTLSLFLDLRKAISKVLINSRQDVPLVPGGQ